LLALALKAREDDRFDDSEKLIKLATEACDQADEMDRREVQVQHQQPQQQQQGQPQQQAPSETEKKA
jgi:hypothetical protein